MTGSGKLKLLHDKWDYENSHSFFNLYIVSPSPALRQGNGSIGNVLAVQVLGLEFNP